VYLRAKALADEALMASEREWTIVRPGLLTDDSGTGRVRIDSEPFRERVPSEDVAAVLNVVLHEPRSSRRVLYVGSGEDEIEAAVEKVLGRTGASAPVGAGEPRRP
jgi:nucleoside-diphosphate-sugar epimerase